MCPNTRLGLHTGRFGTYGGYNFGLPTPASNWHVTKSTAFGPVAATGLAEVAWLSKVVIVVVTEFGVCRVAPRATQRLLWGRVVGERRGGGV